MPVKFLSFDAFGTYVAGGPIDQIIDAFEKEHVLYKHHLRTRGLFDMAYLSTCRSEKIIRETAEQHYAWRLWRFRNASLELLEEHFPEEGFDHLFSAYRDAFPLFDSFSIEIRMASCSYCCESCPVMLIEATRCPDCKDLP